MIRNEKKIVKVSLKVIQHLKILPIKQSLSIQDQQTKTLAQAIPAAWCVTCVGACSPLWLNMILTGPGDVRRIKSESSIHSLEALVYL